MTSSPEAAARGAAAGVPTMKHVAAHAGVALKTVSRYVNGETNIDPALVARIQDAIVALGYRRNLAAASIRPGRTSQLLGLIISDLANPYYSVLAAGLEREAARQGYWLTIASSGEDGATHDRIVDRLMEFRADALIVVPPRNPARSWTQVVPPVPPVVFVDRPGDLPGAHAVLADNAGGARQAVEALVAAGARRVGFVGDAAEIHTMSERLRGYREALAAAGIEPDVRWVSTRVHTSDDARQEARRLVGEVGVDALFAANNRASIGALLAFDDLGRRVPIIGFDEIETAALARPALSVVSHDVAAMGERAARLAIAQLRGEVIETPTPVIPVSLTLRGSERP